MSSDVQRRDQRKSASFHDAAARAVYTPRFGAIGIAAVAAHASLGKAVRATPAASDIPAILRAGPGSE